MRQVCGGDQDCDCVVEALDRTLRALAPEAEAMSWHAANKRPPAELHEGRPTRALRARNSTRDRPGERKLTICQIDSVVALVAAVQSPLQGASMRRTPRLPPWKCC